MWNPIFIVLVCLPFVFSQTTLSLVTSIVITTAAPTSAFPGAFIGYTTESAYGDYTTWDCPQGQIWKVVGSYARCCDNNPFVECGIATACFNTSLMVGPNSEQIWTCSGTASQTTCVTGTVYPSSGATTGIVTNCQCWPSWAGKDWDATRVIATTTTTPSTETLSPISFSSTPIASTPTNSITITNSPQTSTASPSPPPSPKAAKTTLRTGPIIGIAISILVLIALAISAILYKRRNHILSSRKASSGIGPEHGFKSELPGQSRGTAAGEGDDIQPVVSMDGDGDRDREGTVPVRSSDDTV